MPPLLLALFENERSALIPIVNAVSCVGCMRRDIDEHQVGLARSRYPYKSFTVGAAYELAFAPVSFDLVFACEVFEHLDHPDKAM